MRLLLVDGANFAHRARAGFDRGPNAFIFNFFRNLRALVEFVKPDNVIYVLEGKPVARNEMHSEYKANRAIASDDPERERKTNERNEFFNSYDKCISLLQKAFPVSIMRHPTHECDDVIHNIAVQEATKSQQDQMNEIVIVSSDTDFIQSLQAHQNIKLYNATKKQWVEAPEYDYVAWKSLRGDGSDNISGIPGVGDKTATKLMTSQTLAQFLQNDPEKARVFERNANLIRFHEFTKEDWEGLVVHHGAADWLQVKNAFDEYKFASILKEKSWDKFTSTFDKASTK